jgi:hypothetical protein
VTTTIDLDDLERKANKATRGTATMREALDARVDPLTLIALVRRVRTAERERDEARAKLPNWSHAEALQQRDAMIAANVAAQAELRALRSERDALRPVVEAAESWREMRYPRSRSWKADCDEDMHLVSAVDAYRASKEGA